MYEITDEPVSGHALARRWGVRTYLLREIARAIIPGGDKKRRRERFVLGIDDQRALRSVFEAIDRERECFGSEDRDGQR